MDGELLGSVAVEPTGDWETYTDVKTELKAGSAESSELFLVFKGEGTDSLFDLDDFTFTTS